MPVPRYWRKISYRYNLEGTQCEKCGNNYYPPRHLCPYCRRDGVMKEFISKGIGTVVTYSVVYQSYGTFEKMVPYVVAIIKLEEGPRLTAQVVCSPEEIKVGLKVRSVFRKIGKEEDPADMIQYGTKFVPIKTDDL